MKLYGGVRGGKRKKLLNFGGSLDHPAGCPIIKISCHYSTNYEWILMKFSASLDNDTRNNWFNVWGDLDVISIFHPTPHNNFTVWRWQWPVSGYSMEVAVAS